MQGKTVLVTGATDGIGKQTALELARTGAYIIVHGRSLEKARATVEEIRGVARDARLELAGEPIPIVSRLQYHASGFGMFSAGASTLLYQAGSVNAQLEILDRASGRIAPLMSNAPPVLTKAVNCV